MEKLKQLKDYVVNIYKGLDTDERYFVQVTVAFWIAICLLLVL